MSASVLLFFPGRSAECGQHVGQGVMHFSGRCWRKGYPRCDGNGWMWNIRVLLADFLGYCPNVAQGEGDNAVSVHYPNKFPGENLAHGNIVNNVKYLFFSGHSNFSKIQSADTLAVRGWNVDSGKWEPAE